VLGGTQSLHTNSLDEALWLPTEGAVRVALRTQQIIAHESKAGDTVDPLGGSYAIEYLTDQIEAEAENYIERIEGMGGALAAIQRGFVQNEIQNAAYRFQQALEAGDEIVVGVNAFQVDEDTPVERLQVDPALEAAARQRLAALRQRRDAARAGELLGQLETAARGSQNLMPLFIECVENNVTLGEICGGLRRVWGEYQPPTA
jgi:methylmalonyl-CoA mutase N-terminal domain/subunit